MVAESTSRRFGRLAPTALTWAPAEIHPRSITGSAESVARTTRSAPRTASSTLGIGSTRIFPGPDISSAKRRARSALRLATRTRRSGRTQASASRWVRACVPEPTRARSPASSRDKSRVASADTAAVLIAVTAAPFMSARSSPVSPSNRATAPWWVSICRAALPAKIPMAFRPKAGRLPPW